MVLWKMKVIKLMKRSAPLYEPLILPIVWSSKSQVIIYRSQSLTGELWHGSPVSGLDLSCLVTISPLHHVTWHVMRRTRASFCRQNLRSSLILESRTIAANVDNLYVCYLFVMWKLNIQKIQSVLVFTFYQRLMVKNSLSF